jgi:hypothetical protein
LDWTPYHAGFWTTILYEVAANFHHWPTNRARLIDVMSPLHYRRVDSFMNQTPPMKSLEAENPGAQQAEVFEKQANYLLQVWEREKKSAHGVNIFQELLEGKGN